MKTSKSIFILLFLVIPLIFLNCEKIDNLCDGDDCFSVDVFSEKLKDNLDGKAVGWGFAIFAEGNLQPVRSGGYRRTKADPPETLFAVNKRMTIASVTKTLTAIAVLQLINKHSLNTSDQISPYLPDYWTLGSNVANLTFKELLTHTSGFRSNTDNTGQSYDEIKELASEGVALSNQEYKYENMNFALFRIMIPYIDGFDDTNYCSSRYG